MDGDAVGVQGNAEGQKHVNDVLADADTVLSIFHSGGKRNGRRDGGECRHGHTQHLLHELERAHATINRNDDEVKREHDAHAEEHDEEVLTQGQQNVHAKRTDHSGHVAEDADGRDLHDGTDDVEQQVGNLAAQVICQALAIMGMTPEADDQTKGHGEDDDLNHGAVGERGDDVVAKEARDGVLNGHHRGCLTLKAGVGNDRGVLKAGTRLQGDTKANADCGSETGRDDKDDDALKTNARKRLRR